MKEVSLTFQFWLRFTVVATVIIVCLVVSYYSIDIKGDAVHGVRDVILMDTKPLNDWFREDITRRNTLLIICSGLLDTMMIIAFYRFIRYATTYRMLMTMITFYTLRAIVQHLWYVEFPEGYDWGFPGFMSIFVPYGETADFFYSGHVGICMIMFLEFWAVGWKFMAIYSLFTMAA